MYLCSASGSLFDLEGWLNENDNSNNNNNDKDNDNYDDDDDEVTKKRIPRVVITSFFFSFPFEDDI